MKQKIILLNGGREYDIEPSADSHIYLTRLLGSEPAKQAELCLRLTQDERGRQRTAIFVGDQHIGHLPHNIDKAILATVKACEIHGVIAHAKGSLTASWQQPGKVQVKIDLADPDHLLASPAQPAAMKTATVAESEDTSTSRNTEFAAVVKQTEASTAASMLSSSFEEAAALMDLDEPQQSRPQSRRASNDLERADTSELSTGWTEDYPDWPPPKPKPAVTAQPIIPDQPTLTTQAPAAPQPHTTPRPTTPRSTTPNTPAPGDGSLAPEALLATRSAWVANPDQSQAQEAGWLGSKAPLTSQSPAPEDEHGTNVYKEAGPYEHGQSWQNHSQKTGWEIDDEIEAVWAAPTSSPRPLPPINKSRRGSKVIATWIIVSLAVLMTAAAAFVSWKTISNPKTLTSEDFGYSFVYPRGWETANEDEMLGAFAGLSAEATPLEISAAGYGFDLAYPDEVAVVAVMVFDGSVFGDSSQLALALETYFAEDVLDPSMEIINPVAAATVGGLSGYETTVKMNTDEFDTIVTCYYLIDTDSAYILFAMSTPDAWDDNQEAFEQFFDSFSTRAVEP